MSRAANREQRRFPPIWLLVVWGLLTALVLWLQNADIDEGFRNSATILTVLLAVAFGALWFVLSSAFSARLRVGVILALLLAGFGLSRVLEFDGFSGAMIPSFRLRSSATLGTASTSDVQLDLTTTSEDDFSGFLGSHRDGYVPHVQLAVDWEAQPPLELWRQPIGEGWSSFAVVNGTAVTQEQRGDIEAVTAYDVQTGALLWMHSLADRYENLLGDDGPRATPAIAQGRVLALSARGILMCIEGSDGTLLWQRDLKADFEISPEDEAQLVQYGRATSPLVIDDQVIVAPGGGASPKAAGLAAYALEDGTLLWSGPPRDTSYASPTLATLGGELQILTVNSASVSGHAPEDGRLLWEFEWPGPNPSVSQPVAIAPDRVLVSKGYGAGAALVRIVAEGETFATEVVWRERRALRTKFTNVVVTEDHVYGLSEGTLECVELETGQRKWKKGRFGHGQILRVGEHLLIFTEEGAVVLHALDPESPRVLGEFQAVDGKTWNNPALYGDVLLLRNASEVAAFRLPTIAK